MVSGSGVVCCNCDNSSPNYKCPVCRVPYCSVNCCREHKSKGCTKPQITEPEKLPAVNLSYPTEDTVPLEKLKELRNSSRLRKHLENPHLRHIMEVIDKSTDSDLLAKAMLEPIFNEFANECLKVVQSTDVKKANVDLNGIY